ncbi:MULTISPECIES: hypothetical protein [Streptomyces]|uniref:hypothetical protein n=1 Tax=Streptomyces TaxID=1883 RepID=UPI0016799EC8|nr:MULTISPECIES: hypothetical protein [Streptomyces]WPR54886.1 hypothetical protein SJI45_06305 [Streptomyces sp. S399]WSU38285.1 hypothetical protein OG378_22200 [Streptomyces gougerotii]
MNLESAPDPHLFGRQIPMAKNKNRKQGGSRTREAADTASQQTKEKSSEAISSIQSSAQGSPADVARKHQRKFGHN